MKKIIVFLCCLVSVLALASCESKKSQNSSTNQTEHTHTYTTSIVAPSCTVDGYTLHSCSLCGEKYSDTFVKALGHHYVDEIEDAFCNQYQSKVYRCSLCQDSYSESLDIIGTIHSYISTVTYPNNQDGGFTTHVCKNCNHSFVDSYTDPVDFSVGLAYTEKSGKYYVSGIGTCTDAEIIIPSISEKGFKVTGISENAFANANITSIIVSDGVNSIQQGAFYDCVSLQSLTLPKSISISEDIFFNNPVLCSLTMSIKKPLAYYFVNGSPTPDIYKFLTQGDGTILDTYYGAIPYSLKEIHMLNAPCASALSGCDMITKVSIPSNSTSIGLAAFKNCTNLSEISIPDSVTSIGAYAFANTAITSIVIPKNVKFTIENQYIFDNCLKLSEVVFLSKSTILPSYMFLNCISLTQLEISDSVMHLGTAFIAKTSIEHFTIPSAVTEIYSHTFNGCTKLKKVDMHKGIKTIEYCAFQNCTALEEIELAEGIETIGFEAFMGCSSLKKAILPSTLQKIEYSAFKNCTALNQVILPSGLQTIESYLFYGCSSLSEITLPSSLKNIKISAFEASGIVSISIPASVTTTAYRTFADCTQLVSVTFLGDDIELAAEMFAGATSFQTITIPKNVTRIPKSFCKNATSLKTIVFNDALIVIEDEAFLGCTSLEELILPQSLRSIWKKGFKGCTSLKSVDFSNANISQETAQFGVEWFADCTALAEVKNFNMLEFAHDSIFRNTPFANS